VIKNEKNVLLAPVHLRQLAKKSTYLLFLLFFFSAFLGVSRQGSKTREKIESVSKKITGETFFPGGFFLGDFF
jgi:hypothetical protein